MAFNLGVRSSQPSTSNSSPSGNIIVRDVRVKDIVLDPNHPRFEEVGGWSGLGTIFYDSTTTGGQSTSTATLSFAKPMFSNLKFYPLINEVVAILQIADPIESQKQSTTYSKLSFYLPPANLWNSQHHNALPDASVQNPLSEKKSLEQIEGGSPNREQENTTPILLGSTFKEKSKVFPLFPYEGDHIVEGRWGNSIRLGSTVKFRSYPNNWSEVGEEGDPLMILRVNQENPNSTQAGWSPTTEDTSTDMSSIYLTSTQKIPFFASSFKTDSFGNDPGPTSPSEYEGNQIIIDSGRVILNAKQDGILLSSPEVIHLSSGDSINLDCSSRIVLSSDNVYLTSRNARERAVLGDTLVLELQKLLPALQAVAQACTSAAAGPFPVASLITAGPVLESAIREFKTALNGEDPKILSKKVKLR